MTKQGANAWFGKRVGTTQIEAGDVIVVPVDIKQTRFLENLTYGTQVLPARCCGCCGKFLLKLIWPLGHFVQKYFHSTFSVNLSFRERFTVTDSSSLEQTMFWTNGKVQ